MWNRKGGADVAADAWAMIHAERAALADDLTGVGDDRWATPSLCSDWSVHQVLGHLVATTTMNPVRFVSRFARAGFNFTRFNAGNVARHTRVTPTQTLADFRDHLGDRTSAPGPTDTWIGEIVIHGADIRRPLGIPQRTPIPIVLRVADFYTRSDLIVGAKSRVAGLALRATDTDWAHGTGPEVTGAALSLVLAMTGRRAALAELAGAGVDQLTVRMPDRIGHP
jgi:uncharacterized protein (TIGR03083 family)